MAGVVNTTNPPGGENTDRIEWRIELHAPVERVWQALSNAEELGDWFGIDLRGEVMLEGHALRGPITYPGFEHLNCVMEIQKMEALRLLSWQWHPFAIDPSVDYSSEPSTLVTFELQRVGDGTLLSLTESGFDALPQERRETAFARNNEGWSIQMANIRKHVTRQ
jgi:uncharacterized protein YndB with AHSA1/START domain